MLAVEQRLLETAERGQHDARSVVERTIVDRVLDKNRAQSKAPRLNDEQAEAVRHLTESAGRVKLLSGLAGTGKTSTLRVCREVWEKAGFSVIGAALSGKAAEELRGGAGIESYTLKLLEMRMHPSAAYQAKHHLRQLLRAARKARTWKLEPLRFNEKTVLVIDEAGMVGTRQMARLMEEVLEQGGKVVLVGDASQLQAIEAGCPFLSLGKRLGSVMLVDITRQRSEEDRAVVRNLLAGDAAKALESLANRDRLRVAPTRAQALDGLVSRWSEQNRNGLKGVLALASTHQDVDELNQRLQRSRILSGHVKTGEALKLERDFAFVGDRVRFRANSYELGVRNGHLGTVTGINRLTKTLAVALDNGKNVFVSIPRYKHRSGEHKGQSALELGYAATTHAAQGTTLEDAYLLLGGSMQDREMSYVQFSRARGRTYAFMDEISAGENLASVTAAMTRSRAKDLAHDVLLDAGPRQRILL
jgi:ATP-dependent exoDNAse (exonuclease V) alpha subunit